MRTEFINILKQSLKRSNHEMREKPGGGGALVFQAGYHPRKRTFKTHPKYVFFRYENRP